MKHDSTVKPFVTVITPAYNQAAFIEETIESVLTQNYENIEYVVLDDGSTDETPEILKKYTGKIRWESQSNMGQTPTINKGWAMTNSEIVTWLNSDDTFYDADAVKKSVDYLLAHPEAGIVFGDSLFTEADGTPLEKTAPAPDFSYREFVRICENPIAQPSAFIRRDVVRKVGDLDPKYYYFMDWDFWLRAGLHFKIDYIPELLSTYRLHANSKTVAQAKKAAPELQYMYEKFFARDDVSPEIRAVEKEAMMNMRFTSGSYFLKGSDNENAARMAREALVNYPAGAFNASALHKFFYCSFGNNVLYRKSRNVVRSLKSGKANR